MSATKLSVVHLDEDRFRIDVRGHQLLVDQPIEAGGADTAPTPTELFAASLASCVAFFARRYLVRHSLPTAGLAVTSEFATLAEPPGIDIHLVTERER